MFTFRHFLFIYVDISSLSFLKSSPLLCLHREDLEMRRIFLRLWVFLEFLEFLFIIALHAGHEAGILLLNSIMLVNISVVHVGFKL